MLSSLHGKWTLEVSPHCCLAIVVAENWVFLMLSSNFVGLFFVEILKYIAVSSPLQGNVYILIWKFWKTCLKNCGHVCVGERTYGVITKLDLMDKGTNALEVRSPDSLWMEVSVLIRRFDVSVCWSSSNSRKTSVVGFSVQVLEGRAYRLVNPWVGVVNRSQADINRSVDMLSARRREREYFQSSPDYGHFANRMSSEYLGKLLSKVGLSPLSPFHSDAVSTPSAFEFFSHFQLLDDVQEYVEVEGLSVELYDQSNLAVNCGTWKSSRRKALWGLIASVYQQCRVHLLIYLTLYSI